MLIYIADGKVGKATKSKKSKSSSQSKKPKIKVHPKDLPEDLEVLENTIGSDEQNYFLSFLPQTEKEGISIEVDVDKSTAHTELLPPVEASDLDDDEDLVPDPQLPVEDLTPAERIAKLSKQLLISYKKNATLARKNKSLRLQLYAATKKTLSQKAKLEVAKDVLKPFFTSTQIDCFCRPSWLRSRNWAEEDFEIALALRKLMSKKAFGYLRKKRMVPMPSLTSLRKYNKSKGIVIQHNTMKFANSRKSSCLKNSNKKSKAQNAANMNKQRSEQNSTQLIQESQSSISQTQIVQQQQQEIRLVSKPEATNSQPHQQQPVFITTSGGELGNVEFLQQTMDDQSGQVITTTLPMMTTADGATVVQVLHLYRLHVIQYINHLQKGSLNLNTFLQLSGNTDDVDENLGNFANGSQTVQMVMVDPSNPNQFTLQHPITVARTNSSSPISTLAFGGGDNSSQQQILQQNVPRSFARVKTGEGETWKFIQIG